MKKIIYALLTIGIYAQSICAIEYQNEDDYLSRIFNSSSFLALSEDYLKSTVVTVSEGRVKFSSNFMKSDKLLIPYSTELFALAAFEPPTDEEGGGGWAGSGDAPIGDFLWPLVAYCLIYFIIFKKKKKKESILRIT